MTTRRMPVRPPGAFEPWRNEMRHKQFRWWSLAAGFAATLTVIACAATSWPDLTVLKHYPNRFGNSCSIDGSPGEPPEKAAENRLKNRFRLPPNSQPSGFRSCSRQRRGAVRRRSRAAIPGTTWASPSPATFGRSSAAGPTGSPAAAARPGGTRSTLTWSWSGTPMTTVRKGKTWLVVSYFSIAKRVGGRKERLDT